MLTYVERRWANNKNVRFVYSFNLSVNIRTKQIKKMYVINDSMRRRRRRISTDMHFKRLAAVTNLRKDSHEELKLKTPTVFQQKSRIQRNVIWAAESRNRARNVILFYSRNQPQLTQPWPLVSIVLQSKAIVVILLHFLHFVCVCVMSQSIFL